MIIGIGGASRSGKSTLAAFIKNFFEKKNEPTIILDQDNFVLPEPKLPQIKGHPDWDHPDGMDWLALNRAIRAAAKQHQHTIIEGIFAFYNPDLAVHYNKMICMSVDQKTFHLRREKETRWGVEPDWYTDHVWQSHLQFSKCPGTALVINDSFDESAIIEYLRC
ncbi:MAG: hypothetical protein JXQ90_02640 [Cyclobacteriaceae bacterium]